MSGPPPRPKELDDLLGNPSNRPKREGPKPGPGAPTPPRTLSREARAEWRRVVPALAAIGMLSKVDRAALTLYTEAWSSYLDCLADIHENGWTISSETEHGTKVVRNPAALGLKDSTAVVKAFCTEFGLTPGARARMVLPGSSDPDRGLEDYLN